MSLHVQCMGMQHHVPPAQAFTLRLWVAQGCPRGHRPALTPAGQTQVTAWWEEAQTSPRRKDGGWDVFLCSGLPGLRRKHTLGVTWFGIIFHLNFLSWNIFNSLPYKSIHKWYMCLTWNPRMRRNLEGLHWEVMNMQWDLCTEHFAGRFM